MDAGIFAGVIATEEFAPGLSQRGTDGSNPSPSSGESGANLIFGGESHRWPPKAYSGAGQGIAVGRSFLGRRHADRGVGQHEELSPEGRQRRAAGAGPQWGTGLPR